MRRTLSASVATDIRRRVEQPRLRPARFRPISHPGGSDPKARKTARRRLSPTWTTPRRLGGAGVTGTFTAANRPPPVRIPKVPVFDDATYNGPGLQEKPFQIVVVCLPARDTVAASSLAGHERPRKACLALDKLLLDAPCCDVAAGAAAAVAMTIRRNQNAIAPGLYPVRSMRPRAGGDRRLVPARMTGRSSR